jgi:hypothetical protein
MYKHNDDVISKLTVQGCKKLVNRDASRKCDCNIKINFIIFNLWLLELDKAISRWRPMASLATVSAEFFASETTMALQLHTLCWIQHCRC